MIGDHIKQLVNMKWTLLINSLPEECQELICDDGINLVLFAFPIVVNHDKDQVGDYRI